MNISQKVIGHLEQLVAKGPEQAEALLLDSVGQRGYLVGVPLEEHNLGVTLTLQGYDRHSVVLRQLEVNSVHSVNGSDKVKNLRAYAERIIERLSYLEEPLALLELDAVDGIAQLRSSPPEAEEEQSTYWEIIVRVDPHLKVNLVRYRWTAGQPEREPVVYPATFATLGRIAQDLAYCLTENTD
jgi:hypothetical protein